jgi:hypothetical protein
MVVARHRGRTVARIVPLGSRVTLWNHPCIWLLKVHNEELLRFEYGARSRVLRSTYSRETIRMACEVSLFGNTLKEIASRGSKSRLRPCGNRQISESCRHLVTSHEPCSFRCVGAIYSNRVK